MFGYASLGETHGRGPFDYARWGETYGRGSIGYVILGNRTIYTFEVILKACGIGGKSLGQWLNVDKIMLFCDLSVQVD